MESSVRARRKPIAQEAIIEQWTAKADMRQRRDEDARKVVTIPRSLSAGRGVARQKQKPTTNGKDRVHNPLPSTMAREVLMQRGNLPG